MLIKTKNRLFNLGIYYLIFISYLINPQLSFSDGIGESNDWVTKIPSNFINNQQIKIDKSSKANCVSEISMSGVECANALEIATLLLRPFQERVRLVDEFYKKNGVEKLEIGDLFNSYKHIKSFTYKPCESTFWRPKIGTVFQFCLYPCCVRSYHVHDWNGDCKLYSVGNFNIGELRSCARITPPKKYGNNSNKTRICNFFDPVDLADRIVGFQPFHQNHQLKEGKITESLLNLEGSPSISDASTVLKIFSLVSELLNKHGLIKINHITGISEQQFEVIYHVIITALSFINIDIAKYHFGSNKQKALEGFKKLLFIDQGNLGCIDIPLGPYPPPFCSKVTSLMPAPVVSKICAKDEKSVIMNICEKGINKDNSFENPLIRVSFNNILTECKKNIKEIKPDDSEYGKCVEFSNIDVENYNKLTEWNKSSRSIIKNCNKTSNNEACVKISGPSNKNNNDYITYYQVLDSGYKPLSFADPLTQKIKELDLITWVEENSGNNINLHGINNSQFIDLENSFKLTDTTVITKNKINDEEEYQIIGIVNNYNTQNTDTFTIKDHQGFEQKLKTKFMNDNKDICAYRVSGNNDIPLGCFPRSLPPKPTVIPCNDTNCKSFHSQPAMQVSLGNDIVHKTVMAINNSSAEKVNLHGIEFSVIATDNDYSTPDIKGDLNNETSNYNNKQYDGSIVYKGGRYIVGAKKLCLKGYEPNEYVLAKKDDDFKVSEKLSDRIAPPYVKGEEVITRSVYQNLEGQILYKDNNQVAKNNLDPTKEGLRKKNPMELGLCVDVPQPKCLAVEDKELYAKWPVSYVSYSPFIQVDGICLIKDQVDKQVITRACEYDPKNYDQGEWGKVKGECVKNPPWFWPKGDDLVDNNQDEEWWTDKWFKYYSIGNPGLNKVMIENNHHGCFFINNNYYDKIIVCRNGKRFCYGSTKESTLTNNKLVDSSTVMVNMKAWDYVDNLSDVGTYKNKEFTICYGNNKSEWIEFLFKARDIMKNNGEYISLDKFD